MPSPVACATLPSLCSSIIYGSLARIWPEIHSPQSLTFRSHTDLSELLTSPGTVSPRLLSVSVCSSPPDPSRRSTNPHPALSWLQVSRGHEGAGGCSEQLKQIWVKKSRPAPAGSASLTSPATSSFATSITGYAASTCVQPSFHSKVFGAGGVTQ